MAKKETKGRSVVSSIILLMLCFAMLLGTTYAWFTDSKSTAINNVKSGTLKVDIVNKKGNTLVGQSLGFVTADGRDQDEILWEPGCTYKVREFYIQNNGNLALKYKIYVNGLKGDSKLLEVIDWTMTQNGQDLDEYVGYLKPGEMSEYPVCITGHMQESAGNEYQDLEADGIGVTVVATQYTVEYDSYSNQYDKNAEFVGYGSAITESDILAALGDKAEDYKTADETAKAQMLKDKDIIKAETGDYYEKKIVNAEFNLEKGVVLNQGAGAQINLVALAEDADSMELTFKSGVEQPVSVVDGKYLAIGTNLKSGEGIYTLTYRDEFGNTISEFDAKFQAINVSGNQNAKYEVKVGETVTITADGQHIDDFANAKKVANFKIESRNGKYSVDTFEFTADGKAKVTITGVNEGNDYVRLVSIFDDGTECANNIAKVTVKASN